MRTRAVLVWLLLTFAVKAADRSGGFIGSSLACDQYPELLNHSHMELGVRFSTSHRELAAEFVRAMDFWSTIVDMTWYRTHSGHCAIELVDGAPDLFTAGQVARAQLPGKPWFQGCIAFNPGAGLSSNDLFLVAVHELGHLLGLKHSASVASVMYFIRVESQPILDHSDLRALASRHKLRGAAASGRAVAVRENEPAPLASELFSIPVPGAVPRPAPEK